MEATYSDHDPKLTYDYKLGRTAALNEVREIADGLLYYTEDGKELDPIQELKDRLTNLEKGK